MPSSPFPPHNINSNLNPGDSSSEGASSNDPSSSNHNPLQRSDKKPKHYGQPHEALLPGAAHSISESVQPFHLKRYLETAEGRKHLADKLEILDYNSHNAEKLDRQVELILKKLEKFGTVVDKNEKRTFLSPSYQQQAYAEKLETRRQEAQDNMITFKEKEDRRFKEGRKAFLYEWLGLKKNE